MSVDKLAAQLATLCEKDARHLLDLVQGVLHLSSVSKDTPDSVKESERAREWYEALAEALTKATKSKPMPFFAFKKTRYWQAFASAVPVATSFLNTLDADRLRQHALRRWLAFLVVEDVRRNQRLEWFNISAALGRLPMLVDDMFPNYGSSGLLGTVVNLMLGGNANAVQKAKAKGRGNHNHARPLIEKRRRGQHRRR